MPFQAEPSLRRACDQIYPVFIVSLLLANISHFSVVGTHSSVNNTFQLGSFEALYTNEQFEVEIGSTLQSNFFYFINLHLIVLVPCNNVATIANNAIVIEGVSRSRNALLNGDSTNYDWDNGFENKIKNNSLFSDTLATNWDRAPS